MTFFVRFSVAISESSEKAWGVATLAFAFLED
jgi:hypothetical protein